MIDCSKCLDNPKSQCCGIFGMDKELVEKHKDKFQVKPTKIIGDSTPMAVITEDLLCVFLNRQTRKCSIYEDRPEVCIRYGYNEEIPCPYFKRSGNLRSEASKKQIMKMYDKKLKQLMKLVEKK